jgi:hypothetical protein
MTVCGRATDFQLMHSRSRVVTGLTDLGLEAFGTSHKDWLTTLLQASCFLFYDNGHRD